jgi:hypothetical protein
LANARVSHLLIPPKWLFAKTNVSGETVCSGIWQERVKARRAVLRLQTPFGGTGKSELLNFCITSASADNRDLSVIHPLCKKLFGKLHGDKGYISASLCELLFGDGLHSVTGIKNNMENRLMTVRDNIFPVKTDYREIPAFAGKY